MVDCPSAWDATPAAMEPLPSECDPTPLVLVNNPSAWLAMLAAEGSPVKIEYPAQEPLPSA